MLDHHRRNQLLRRAIRNNPERAAVFDWLLLEWDAYADDKWDDARESHEKSMREDGWIHNGFWNRQVNQYFDRAALQHGEAAGLTPNGRQAALKALAVLVDGCASMIRNCGLPPRPGQASGYLEPWDSDQRQNENG